MKCLEVEELISAYLEDELSKEQAREVELHLVGCESCRRLKEKVDELIHVFPDLEEEVPFFLKNRLYYIPESQEIIELNQNRLGYLKWVAAVIGTFVLMLNLFYFTNIFPAANRALHSLMARIKTITVETGAFFEKVKDSRGAVLASVFDAEDETDMTDQLLDEAPVTNRDDGDAIDIENKWDENNMESKKNNEEKKDDKIKPSWNGGKNE